MNYLTSIPRMIGCTIFQYKTKVAPYELKSLNNHLAIVTGGNSGIGFETVKSLATQGCEVIVLCRNVEKSIPVVNEINILCREVNSTGSCRLFTLDLADLNSVTACAEEVRGYVKERKIDYFFCNGGIMMQPYSKSPQGYEIHYATNHLGHFALVGLLIDLLRTSHSRVMVITGDIAVLADDASHDYEYNDSGLEAYCRSKICNQAFTIQLHQRYPELHVFSIHPGVINSHLVAPMEGLLGRVELALRPLFMIDCKKGAQTSLYCALTTSESEVPNGCYYHNAFGVTKPHATAANPQWSGAMWNTSVELCKDNNITLKY